MDLLRNPVRHYPWGSRTAIADLLGRPVPSPVPEAELWLGAHSGGSSVLIGPDGVERSLFEVVRSDPSGQLGTGCVRRWGSHLPFLLKVLAVDAPLSLQAHPSHEHAAECFAREEAAGIPVDSPDRTCPDPAGKPELLCAVTEFHALAGFREPLATVRFLRQLDLPDLREETAVLADHPNGTGLRAVLTRWLGLPAPVHRGLIAELLDACAAHARDRGEFLLASRTIVDLGTAYPDDAAVLAALLLNRIVLQPGEAIFLAPGVLHAYLHGTAVELQASSDNTVRCGLTGKHVDVRELLRIVDFESTGMAVTRGEHRNGHVITYGAAAEEFELSRASWQDDATETVRFGSSGPQILLCTQGKVQLLRQAVPTAKLELSRGDSVWLGASEPTVLVEPIGNGGAHVFRAALP